MGQDDREVVDVYLAVVVGVARHGEHDGGHVNESVVEIGVDVPGDVDVPGGERAAVGHFSPGAGRSRIARRAASPALDAELRLAEVAIEARRIGQVVPPGSDFIA